MEFAWRRDGSGPTDWLPPDGERWHWPLHGLRLGNDVILFCTRVERTGASGPFGFRAVGWTAFKIAGVDGPLAQWRAEPLPTPSSKFPVVVGTGVVDRGEHVYAFALREPGDHALLLLRWPRAAVARGDLLAPEWWDLGGWRPHAQMHAAPTAVLGEAAPEFTVFAVAGGYAMVQSLGFGSSDLAVRTAPALTGPWSAAASVLHPPESDRQGVFTYAGKGLPLEGGTVLATYASNAWDFGELVRDERLYYPHCVRLSFSGGSTR
jgi:hypothetical protein